MPSKKPLSSHDQNFKNLTVDYPIQSIEFYAHKAFPKIEGNPSVTFLRQESNKYRLSQHHRELDIPILLEWPEQEEKAVVIFAIEAESNPYRFDPIRLAQYSLDLAKQHKTTRVVPIVVFTSPGKFKEHLQLGTEQVNILQFQFIYCQLSELDYREWRNSNNIVARLTLPLMRYEQQEKLELVHKSIEGLAQLEPDENKQGKYIEFIEQYAKLSEQEIDEFKKRYPQEDDTMAGYYHQRYLDAKQELQATMQAAMQAEIQTAVQAEIQTTVKKAVETAVKKAVQTATQEGEQNTLRALLTKRFTGSLAALFEDKILSASKEELERWTLNILDAETIEDVFI